MPWIYLHLLNFALFAFVYSAPFIFTAGFGWLSPLGYADRDCFLTYSRNSGVIWRIPSITIPTVTILKLQDLRIIKNRDYSVKLCLIPHYLLRYQIIWVQVNI